MNLRFMRAGSRGDRYAERAYQERAERDPFKGDFDPESFRGEVIEDCEFTDGRTRKITSIEERVRITDCPYDDAGKCVWRWGPTITRLTFCLAVRQTQRVDDPNVVKADEPLCKAHIPRKDQRLS